MFQINQVQAPQLVKDFIIYILTIKGRSPRTAEGYYIDLRLFLRYLKASKLALPMTEKNLTNIDITDIPEDMILAANISDAYGFLNYALSQNENQASARARKVSSIRSFYLYLFDKTSKLSTNPMESLEVPSKKKTLPKYLTLDESITLLKSIDGKFIQRDFCMITFMLNCGMRVSELVGIGVDSFTGDNALRLLGKGNKERIVYLNDACLLAKENYDKVRINPVLDQHKNTYFLSKRGTKLTTRRIEQIVETHLKTAGLSGRGISPHKLRHTAATLMYQHGNVDIRVLKEILGHANLGTTEIYTHISSTQLENAAKASPLSNAMLTTSKVKVSKTEDQQGID